MHLLITHLYSNDADLRMVEEMGVEVHDSSKDPRTPRRKFKCAIATVTAVVRMSKMAREWRMARELGEDLRRAKTRAPMSRRV